MSAIPQAAFASLLVLAAVSFPVQAHSPAAPAPGASQADAPPSATLFQNVRIFDGTGSALSAPSHVLVSGKTIKSISTAPVTAEPGTTIIDGNGRTLMPGLIDSHWHTMLVSLPVQVVMTADSNLIAVAATAAAQRTLMRGFTSVRDVGGSSFGLKRAIDTGIVPGPRIYPSGAMISVTSGHGDFRMHYDVPRTLGSAGSRHDLMGHTAIADSPDEVRVRVREQLMLGASQIKLTAGGGVSSPNSPLDAVTFTVPELRAAVEAATNWGTYVAVHAYTAEAIKQAIEAGVGVIEHASLMDEEAAELMAKNDVWLSAQPFPQELGNAFPPGSDERAKFDEVFAGTDQAFKLARKHKIKTAFGTDILFSAPLARMHGAILASLTRWYTPAEALALATGAGGELAKLTGKRNPYPGEIGVVKEGAFADLLLVDGDPVADINLVAKPEESFLVIMKDGVVYKNTVPAR